MSSEAQKGMKKGTLHRVPHWSEKLSHAAPAGTIRLFLPNGIIPHIM